MLSRLFGITITMLALTLSGCRHVDHDDACGLITKADVEKVSGTKVKGTVVEAAHAVSMAEGRVMHSTASCAYLLEPASGKPARIKISADVYGDHVDIHGNHMMQSLDFGPWKGAQHITGIGQDAWQDTTALEILIKDTNLTIETDQTPESPKDPIPPSEETQSYPGIQVSLARIALSRLE